MAEVPENAAPISTMAITAGLAALAMTAALPPPLWGFVFIPILIVALLVAALIGLPLYLVGRRLGWINGWAAAASGFVAGAALPVALILPGAASRDTWVPLAILLFGLAGTASALVFLTLLLWPNDSRRKRTQRGAAAATVIAAAYLALWFSADHSCHNPVWNGRGIAPSASFRVDVPVAEWRDIAAEVDRFAREHQWLVRTDAAFEPDRPWFGMSACRSDGTDIQVSRNTGETGFAIYVYQPQGGDSWKPPMRDLHARMRARWPEAIQYQDDLGAWKAQPSDWVAPRALPAARSAPSPAPPGSRP